MNCPGTVLGPFHSKESAMNKRVEGVVK